MSDPSVVPPEGGWYGVAGFVTALGSLVTVLVRGRTKTGPSPLADLREDIKELRKELVESRHEIRDQLQPLVTKVAVLERDLHHLQRHCPILEERGR